MVGKLKHPPDSTDVCALVPNIFWHNGMLPRSQVTCTTIIIIIIIIIKIRLVMRTYVLYNCCTLWWGPWPFVDPRGKMAPEAKPNIITIDYSLFNKQTNKKQFPRTHGCFVQSAGNRPTLGTIKVMCTGVHHFSCYPASRAMYHAFLLRVTWLVLDQSNFAVCYRGITILFVDFVEMIIFIS